MVGVSVRTVLDFQRHVAHEAGVAGGRGGAVVIIQRFGGALNLNVHVHAIVIDGACARDRADLRFYPAPWLTTADVADVLATIVPRVRMIGSMRRVSARLPLASERNPRYRTPGAPSEPRHRADRARWAGVVSDIRADTRADPSQL